jgi:hypothetical protein
MKILVHLWDNVGFEILTPVVMRSTILLVGHAVAYIVEALCYKLKNLGSIPDEITGFFNWLNPFSRTMAQKPTQPVTNKYQESSWGVKGSRSARKADNLTAICKPII